jgi:endonuclease/exonuclease/phosphatase family metal-dependent hydrolase
MRRRPAPVRASLALAVLVTAMTLVLGSLLTAERPSSPGPTAAADLAAATSGDRTTGTSRDLSRPTVDPGSAPSSGGSSAPADGAEQPSAPAPDAPGAAADEVAAPPATTSPAAPAAALPPYTVKRSGKALRKLPPGPQPGDPFTFQVGTLNILGSQHARNGVGRASALAGAVLGRGVDLVGLQEVQDDQLAAMSSRLPGWTIWPGQSLGNQGVRLQIAFDDALFELVDTGSVTTVFDYQQRPIPWVLLRDRTTGGEFYVIDVHNSPGGQERDRDIATGTEIGLVKELRATGKPVMLMGDTNEHTEFACRVAAETGMVGSNGLSAAGGCSVGTGPIKIDWILGGGGVGFSDHVVDYGAPVSASTDHAFVHATVTVTPEVTSDTTD